MRLILAVTYTVLIHVTIDSLLNLIILELLSPLLSALVRLLFATIPPFLVSKGIILYFVRFVHIRMCVEDRNHLVH
jgi:hypothetical protein